MQSSCHFDRYGRQNDTNARIIASYFVTLRQKKNL